MYSLAWRNSFVMNNFYFKEFFSDINYNTFFNIHLNVDTVHLPIVGIGSDLRFKLKHFTEHDLFSKISIKNIMQYFLSNISR